MICLSTRAMSDVIVLLECGHTTAAHSKDETERYCTRCRDAVSVRLVIENYRVVCRTCHYGRKYGAGLYAADLALRRHRNKYPEHLVQLMRDDTVMTTLLPSAIVTETLP